MSTLEMKNNEEEVKDIVRQQRVDILALKRIKVLDEYGGSIRVSSLWEISNHSVIIVFVRHFSCIGCRAHVDKINNLVIKSKKNKLNIVFIGNGSPRALKNFKEDMNITNVKIYTDPTLESFEACGMNHGFRYLLDARSLGQMMKLKKEGYAQKQLNTEDGSHRQMGGVIAFDKKGQVKYIFTSRYLGDFDSPEAWPQ